MSDRFRITVEILTPDGVAKTLTLAVDAMPLDSDGEPPTEEILAIEAAVAEAIRFVAHSGISPDEPGRVLGGIVGSTLADGTHAKACAEAWPDIIERLTDECRWYDPSSAGGEDCGGSREAEARQTSSPLSSEIQP